jgi:hypothetical protein
MKSGKKSMHRTAMAGKKHGNPMPHGDGAHQKPPAVRKQNAQRKGTQKSGGKLTP